MDKNDKKQNSTARPPVVVVMGHIDHGKSTLLDYIRKTNIAEMETGGITQSISAYEVVHKPARPNGRSGGDEWEQDRKITFLDTPGHEAYSQMRERGAAVADIAILVVSAVEGVKPQTIEAWKAISRSQTPCIVAINKIDKPESNVEKTKKELAENAIYLENYGGKIPFSEISAKTGVGVESLLSLILILAELEGFTGNADSEASGFVIEANLDSKRGIQATLIIKDGSLTKGMTVVVEDCICSTRIIENFKGENIDAATFSSPIRIFGFDKIPTVGSQFKTFKNKPEAEKYAEKWKDSRAPLPNPSQENKSRNTSALPVSSQTSSGGEQSDKKIIPILLKADVSGSLEAVEKGIMGIKSEGAKFKIIAKGVGPISESDIKNIGSDGNAIVIGFNVKADRSALEIAQKRGLAISFFDIIYKLTEWLEVEMENRRPRIETMETIGKAKIIRAFSRTKERQIVGGRVTEGQMLINGTVRIMRRDFEIGRGKIVNLEKGKVKTGVIPEGSEFGTMIESKMEIAPGDIIELFSIEQK